MAEDHDIRREVTGDQGRYVILRDGDEAELTYTIVAPDLVTADHTGVPDAFRGTGAGRALVERLMADAQSEGFRVVPLCSFVAGLKARHPEWAALFQ